MPKKALSSEVVYNVFNLPLPTEAWKPGIPGTLPCEARKLISKLYHSEMIAICHPAAELPFTAGTSLLRLHKGFSWKLENVCLSALCSVEFIKHCLSPFKLRVITKDNGVQGPIGFSVTYDEGLHIQISRERFRQLGLPQIAKISRHKDGYISIRLDITSTEYLNEDSKLYMRTREALKRLGPANCFASSCRECDYKLMERMLSVMGTCDCIVTPLEQKASTGWLPGDEEIGVFTPYYISHFIENLLKEGGSIMDNNAEAVAAGSEDDNDYEGDNSAGGSAPQKKRKVFPSEDNKDSLDDDFSKVMKNKSILFKAHRTVSQPKNWRLDKLRNVIREVEAADVGKPRVHHHIIRLRHSIDDLVLRGMYAPNPPDGSETLQERPTGFVVSLLKGGFTSAESLFDLFRSCCAQLESDGRLFVLCASAPTFPSHNMHRKNLGTAPEKHYIYVVFCRDPVHCRVSAVFMTSQ